MHRVLGVAYPRGTQPLDDVGLGQRAMVGEDALDFR